MKTNTNFPTTTLRRIAVALNGGVERGSQRALARFCGVSEQTVKGWLSEPGDPLFRRMNKSAARLVAVLVFFYAAGQMDGDVLRAVKKIQEKLKAGDAAVMALVAKVNALPEQDEEDEEDVDE